MTVSALTCQYILVLVLSIWVLSYEEMKLTGGNWQVCVYLSNWPPASPTILYMLYSHTAGCSLMCCPGFVFEGSGGRKAC